jgi:hypothetical protein
MRRELSKHLKFMLFGYWLAALTVSFLLLLWPNPKNTFRHADFISMLVFFSVLISAFAAPVAAPFIFFAERKSIRSALSFACAGVLAGLFSLVAVNSLTGWPDPQEMSEENALILFGVLSRGEITEWLLSIAFGMVGGLVYWAAAGKRSGQWRSSPLSPIPAGPVDEWTLK